MWEPDFSKKPPVQPLTPAEQAKKFWLPPGFKLEPVLTDPDIEEPAQIAFDGNGRMFVLEIRGYMQDADGGGTLDPVARISLHEDKNSDGVYETHHVFVDKLVFPRFVMPFGGNAILAKESNADEVWKYTDTNNDNVADKKELFATGMGRVMNVEHQESGLTWGLDNWIYSTINPVRLKWTPGGVLRESTGSNGGQWGVTMDNYGKMWFQAGASGMPGYFQTPIQYGNFTNPEQFETDLNITWGAPVLIADMQGGMNAVRMPDGSLARATGSAGNDVYRGDRLPKDLMGDYFYGEVVARIVRRLHPVKSEGLTQLRNVYPFAEFIRSTDPLFRPVDVTTAPDGTMYITDMYRGIIQESQWSGPGTYLRQRIDQYGLDKLVKKGRIWRLTYEGMGRRTEQPKMLSETPGAAGRAPVRPERLVARHRAAAARAEAGQVGRARAAEAGAFIHRPARADPRAVDARWPGRHRRRAGAAAHGGQGRADSHPGHPRERDAVQGRRQDPRGRLQAPQHRRRHRRRHAVADDDEYLEGGRRRGGAQAGAGVEQGQGCAARRLDGPQPRQRRWTRRRHLHRGGGAVHTRRAGGARQGARGLHAGVLRLSRRGRQRRTRAGIGERTADRAAARGVLPRHRSVGLRGEGAAARRHRPARWHHLSRRDDLDGHAVRRVDRVDRLLRAQCLRQSRAR